ncbi:MAG: hypothetical protein Q4B54_07830 [Coriobacteriales bacterium]|nr:hypothetical protein [Coriobacteriales bacterium]
MQYYLPGCDFNKNHPEAGAKLREYMLAQHGLTEAPCCRARELSAGADDTIVENCTLCELMLTERFPQTRLISLYEWVLSDPAFPWPDFTGREMTLQDCARARNNPQLQDAVRACLDRMHVRYLELEQRREQTRFDGVWLYNPPAPDCVELAPHTFAELERRRELLPPAEQKQRMEQWVARYATDEVAVYCNGCERGVRLGGKQPFQVIELLAEGL